MRLIDRSGCGARYADRVFVPASACIQRRLFLAAEAQRSSARRAAVPLHKLVFLGALLFAAALSAIDTLNGDSSATPISATPWAANFDGKALTVLPLSPVEQRFAAQFPGRIGRFTDGSRNIILRVVEQPTRLLHPAADCFRGMGFGVDLPRVVERADGTAWSCFAATRNGTRQQVCERITDGAGGAWTDVSAWYWAAVLGRTQGPWWAVTVVNLP